MNQHTKPMSAPIPFIDLGAQRQRMGGAVEEAVAKVVASGQYILGPQVGELETQLAKFAGARHAITCSSGTDAIQMILMAKGVGSGDAVICPSFTFCATAEVVALLGATPVFADVDAETFNINGKSIESAIARAEKLGLEAKAIIPVDLFGLSAEHDTIAKIAADHGLFVLDDAAQGFGATYKNKPIGSFGLATATSFFPAKPLGCYGDGGAVFTDSDELAAVLKSIRVHGAGSDRYDNVRIGITGRLDTIQAAVLIEKLKIFPDEIVARDRVAHRYNDGLRSVAIVPEVPAGHTSVWAQYTIRLKPGQRDGFANALKEQGIPTAIYYPKPLHRQTAYKDFPVAGNGLPVSDRIAEEVISLPMHAYLDESTQDRIIEAAKRALA
jgi:dTDP-4-amino-4,6-dideoxygalactose transaminase